MPGETITPYAFVPYICIVVAYSIKRNRSHYSLFSGASSPHVYYYCVINKECRFFLDLEMHPEIFLMQEPSHSAHGHVCFW